VVESNSSKKKGEDEHAVVFATAAWINSQEFQQIKRTAKIGRKSSAVEKGM